MSYGTPPPPPPSGEQPPYGGQPPYGNPGGPYGANPYGGVPAGGPHPRGTLVLVLGILSIVCCGFLAGVPAIIMGKKGLDESKTANYSNAGLLRAGFICGIVGTCLSVIGVIVDIIIFSTR